MDKILKKIGVLLFISLIFVGGCKEQEIPKIENPTLVVEDANKIKGVTQYDMDIAFFPDEKSFNGTQRVEYINQENTPLGELYFHLYPNSFRNKEDAPYLFEDFKNAYPMGFKPGSIDIEKLSIDKNPTAYTLEGKGNTIMKISLPNELLPGEKITIEMDYAVKLPPAQERFGYANDTFNIGNWYPILAVYDDTGWNLDPYYPIGDPFYSDVSNYHVTIETPKDFVVAASGNITKDTIEDDKRIWEIDAKLMRDFAWVASKDFEVVERDVEGTTLKMYFMKDEKVERSIRKWAETVSADALKTFNRVYGKYPYGQYSVVQTNFPSGMEYPGIVYIGKESYEKGWEDYLEIVIVHETAHQWWYGIVGNDQIDEAWLDESFAAYSEAIYSMEIFGEDTGKDYHRRANEDEYWHVVDSLEDEVVLKSLDEFKNWDDYGPLVYSKGAMFLNQLYEKYGKEKFYQMVQTYYERYRFKNATTKDFQDVCQEVTGDDLEGLFNHWLLDQ